jgi:AcrR family transcriptional regulator
MSEVESKPGLRERRNQRTRAAIVRAAAELTVEDCFAAATIPRIAERAEVSPRTVSGWFPVKDDILFDRNEEHLKIAERHFRRGSGDTIDRLRAWLDEELERGDDYGPEIRRLKLDAISSDPDLRARSLENFSAVAALIAASVARDTHSKPTDPGPKIFAGAAVAMLGALTVSSLSRRKATLEADLEQSLRFLEAGLATLR